MAISLYFATVRIGHILTNISDLHFLDLVRVTCNRDYMNPSLYGKACYDQFAIQSGTFKIAYIIKE